MITLENVSCGYGTRIVLNNVSLTFRTGELTCLLGKNGAGKTTLFKTILGLIPSISGTINYRGKQQRHFTAREFAKFISYVPQAHGTPFPFTVLDVVLMGQYAHATGFWGKPMSKNIDIAMQSLHTLGIEYLTYKNFSEISGGEKQLVLIARAMAQQPQFIAMDEPTANLDMGNQYTVLRLSHMLRKQGFGVIMNTHTPEHAMNDADEVVLLQDGTVLDHGHPRQILHSKILTHLYGADVEMIVARMPDGTDKYVCVHHAMHGERCWD